MTEQHQGRRAEPCCRPVPEDQRGDKSCRGGQCQGPAGTGSTPVTVQDEGREREVGAPGGCHQRAHAQRPRPRFPGRADLTDSSHARSSPVHRGRAQAARRRPFSALSRNPRARDSQYSRGRVQAPAVPMRPNATATVRARGMSAMTSPARSPHPTMPPPMTPVTGTARRPSTPRRRATSRRTARTRKKARRYPCALAAPQCRPARTRAGRCERASTRSGPHWH
jgi:hypothetical protein